MSNDSWPPPSIRVQAIPHVLQSIFGNLSNENLFKCRLVRQSWAREAGRVIGKRLDECLCAPNELKTLREIQNGKDIGIHLNKVCIVVPACYDINDSPSQVYDTVTSLELECIALLVPHFVVHLFPNLKSLTLCDLFQVNKSQLQPACAYPWYKVTLPKLLKLRFWLGHDSTLNNWSSLVENFLEKAVKLVSFELMFGDVPAENCIDKFCSSNLKSIKIDGFRISAKILTALSAHRIQFPLEIIDLKSIISDKETLTLLLTRYSSTLRQHMLSSQETFEMNFPLGVLMTNLRTLRLTKFRGSLECRKLPQLKKLILQESYFEGISSSISLTPQYCRLEALFVYVARDTREDFIRFFENTAEHLGRTLQSLKFVTAFSTPLLSIIFTKLTKLNRLVLAEHYPNSQLITDQDLCGAKSLMFTPPVETPSGPPLNKLYKNMIASAKESNHARGPNITDLKDLQFLALEGAFSEVAVLHGIVHCEKLTELILFSASRMSRDSMVHLVVNADLKHLTRIELNEERINPLKFVPNVLPAIRLYIPSYSILKMLEIF